VPVIVNAAIALIDELGPEAFSMRSLASSLGVYPAALYWHVGNRASLLGLIGGEWLVGSVPESGSGSWKDFVREAAHRYRAAAHAHPNVARLLGVELFPSANTLRLPEAAIGSLLEAGIPEDQVIDAYNALVGSIMGFVDVELARMPDDSEELSQSITAELADLDPDRFPNLHRFMDQLPNRTISMRWKSGDEMPLDSSFGYLVELLIDGLERRTRTGVAEPPGRR